MTLRECALYCEGAIYRVVETAWWSEVMARQKKLKKSADLYIDSPKEQTPEELAKNIHAIFKPLIEK